jgi:DNA-binding ferritin-like protein
VLLAIILAAVGFGGYKTITDVMQTIARETAGNVDAVKGQLGQLSKDIDAQTKRVSEKGGEIAERLSKLDAAANGTQAKAEAYLKRADELSATLTQRLTALDTKVAQVSTQVDNLSVRQEYPDLGRAKVVTYKGVLWKKDDKKPGEKWIGIYISPYAISDFTGGEIENLVRDLRAAGYTPLLGMFAIGGPYISGNVGSLGDNGSNSSLYYFSKGSEQMSAQVRAIALKDLPITSLDSSYVDASDLLDDLRQFVIENSGLDLQLVLRPLPKK